MINASEFPLVYLDGIEEADDAAEVGLERLLDRERHFVLISSHLPGDHDHFQDDRKRRALWFKRNKQRLRRWCVGAIIIQQQRSLPTSIKLAITGVSKVFGMPLHLVASDDEARRQGRRLLSDATWNDAILIGPF